MTRKITSLTLVLLLILSLCTLSFGTVSAEASELPDVAEGCNRYFFLVPDDWFSEYTDSVGIYWWEGAECQAYPGYKAHKADAENVYYYDVPKTVGKIIWNNYITVPEDKEYMYQWVDQTGIVEWDPVRLSDCDGKIYVTDPLKMTQNPNTFQETHYGDWYYYYGNGKYGTSGVSDYPGFLPAVKEGYNRYFFMMPEDWYNEFGECAGIYWNTGSETPDECPGYKAHEADSPNVYYYDVPEDVEYIIWNNYYAFDGSEEGKWKSYYTFILYLDGYCSEEKTQFPDSQTYPEGLTDFDNMIYIINPETLGAYDPYVPDYMVYGGEWYYYFGNGEYGTEEPLVDFEDLPEVEIGCYRYFFLMPDNWYNEHTNTAGIYWWDGYATPDEWPGYKAHKADAENVYYYDVPRSVTSIIWNNFIDGGSDKTNPMYDFAKQTANIASEYYDSGENENFPEGTGNFNKMICVVDYDNVHWDSNKPSCNWFYYFGDGEYGTDVDKDARVLQMLYPDNNYDYMTDIVPYFYPDKFEGKAGLPWDMYDTLYAHNESADTAPEYIVFEACVGGADQAFITKKFGDYLVTHHEIHSLYELSHFVYVPSEQKVYTLKEAWDKDDLDITAAFASGSVGRHRGDANLDGSFNIKDATYIQKFLAHFDGFENTGFMNYDGDNDITIKDATAIQKAIAGIKE